MRQIRNIIIHESATPTGRDDRIEDCDKWHIERGFKREESFRVMFNPELKAVGYHYWICVDGTTQTGRALDEVGAHCSGLNGGSVGICLAGCGKYSPDQWTALSTLVRKLQKQFPLVRCIGHCDTPSGAVQGKTCPDFDVANWMQNRMLPDAENVYC